MLVIVSVDTDFPSVTSFIIECLVLLETKSPERSQDTFLVADFDSQVIFTVSPSKMCSGETEKLAPSGKIRYHNKYIA